MTEYNFRLLLDAPEGLSDEQLDRLYEATRSEASFGSDSDGWSAEFDRDAADFALAVTSAIADIARAGLNVRELVSEDEALVNASEIGRRTKQSRETIRLYAEGERKRDLGPFPLPVTTLSNGERIWRWGDVAPWLSRAIGRKLPSDENGDVVSAINDALDLHRRLPRISSRARKAIEGIVDGRVAVA